VLEASDQKGEESCPMLVRDVMTTEVVTVGPMASLKHATELLDTHHVTALPVVDEHGRLVGVLSEADVLRDGLLPDPTRHEIRTPVSGRTAPLRVKDVMTAMPVSVTADSDLAEAARTLVDTQVKSLPVVEHGHLVGIVSRSDVIAMLARRDPLIEAEVDELLRAAEVDFLVEVVDGVVRLDGPTGEHTREIARVLASAVAGVVGVAFES
jgi:CBS domain-containing protein